MTAKTSVPTAILFLGGKKTKLPALIVTDDSMIIAADHGADLAVSGGYIPNIVIGDCDSISPATHKKLIKQRVLFLNFPTNKDKTDSELALVYAIEQGFQKIICFGLEGDRPDHFLANILVFGKYVQKQIQIEAVGEKSHYYFFNKRLNLIGEVGDCLTLLALSPTVKHLCSTGLQYPLRDQTLHYGTSLGVSNIFTRHQVLITLQKGTILAIHTPATLISEKETVDAHLHLNAKLAAVGAGQKS